MDNVYGGDANPFKAIMSFENLVLTIEKLELDGVMPFDEFEALPYHEIKKRFYALPHPTSVAKAKIKIRNKREGREELSEYSTTSVHHSETEIKIIKHTHRF